MIYAYLKIRHKNIEILQQDNYQILDLVKYMHT